MDYLRNVFYEVFEETFWLCGLSNNGQIRYKNIKNIISKMDESYTGLEG